MIKISEERVRLLHCMMIEKTGGSSGLRDTGLLNSAICSAYATFDGTELFPTVEEKAAKIGYSLVANHAFVDGNKRIGVFVMLIFLTINGVKINPSVDEVVAVGLGLASGSVKYPELLNWIFEHKE